MADVDVTVPAGAVAALRLPVRLKQLVEISEQLRSLYGDGLVAVQIGKWLWVVRSDD